MGSLVGCLGYVGDEILPSYKRIIINHEIRIPIEQPGFHGKYLMGFVSWLICVIQRFV